MSILEQFGGGLVFYFCLQFTFLTVKNINWSGYVFFLATLPIPWQTKKRLATVARSPRQRQPTATMAMLSWLIRQPFSQLHE